MNTTYAAQADRFTTTVSAVPDWDAPSPCEGWTVADVVEHVVTTQRDFLGQHADLGSLPSTTDPVARWRAHDAEVREVLPALVDVAYDGHFGPTTVGQTMATFYGFDLLVHRWDVARAAGLDDSLSDDELSIIEAMVPAFVSFTICMYRSREMAFGSARFANVMSSRTRAAIHGTNASQSPM